MSEHSAAGQLVTTVEHPFAAALWDFDGTLADTEPVWFEVASHLSVELGADSDQYDGGLMVGAALERTAAYILQISGRTDVSVGDVTAEMVRRVARRLRASDEINWMPGALELLEAFHAAGIPCGLVSASYHQVLDAVLSRLAEGTFATVVGGDEVTHSKPDPEPYLTAARRLGVRPDACVVLEDSRPGTESGNAAGAFVLAIKNVVDLPAAPRRKVIETLAGVGISDVAGWMVQAEELAKERS